MIIEDIAELLKRKQQMDRQVDSVNNMPNYDGWAIDALVLLLRIALEQEKREKKL